MRDINGRVESYPLTDMRDINGRVESNALIILMRAVFLRWVMKERGFYIIDDQFYIDFPDENLKGNKEENRPHYYAIVDPVTGLPWMIPMSSKIEKYKALIKKRLDSGKPCDTLHICKLDNGKESVFLLQDMFPIIENYISREYTLNGCHFILTSDKNAEIVQKKAMRTLNMIKRGIKFTPTQADVLNIESELLK